MTTINIAATKHARAYVKELYRLYDGSIDKAERLIYSTAGDPALTAINARAIKARREAWDNLEALYDALDALGFMPVSRDGTFWRVVDNVAFERIESFILKYDDYSGDSDASQVFRAVLSSFGISYVSGTGQALPLGIPILARSSNVLRVHV